MRSYRFAAIVSLCAIALSIALYAPTFANFYAYDDIDYINLAAKMFVGEGRIHQSLLLPHNEHFVPVFKILFFTYLRYGGFDPYAWRVFIAIIHACSAIFLALLARRYSGSARAGIATAIAYVGACGFSSMWIWFPTAAPVPLLTAMVTGAAALVAWRDHLTLRRVLAGVAVIAALLTESAFAPLALLPAAIDEYERRRDGRRGIGFFAIFTLTAIFATMAFVATLGRNSMSINVWSGIPRAAFLTFVAPFRFLFPGIPIIAAHDIRVAILGSVLGITIAATIAALLIALWRRGVPSLAIVAALSLPGSLGVIALVGLGRWRVGFQILFEADRYFFPLLVPAALLAGAIAGSIALDGWSRVARAVLFIAMSIAIIGELALHRRAMLGPIPKAAYTQHAVRFDSLTRLTRLLERAGPIELPDQMIWFPDVHNGRIRTAVLTELLSTNRDRLRVGSRTVDEPTAARLNPLFDQWAREIGERVPFLRVVDGKIVNTHVRWRAEFSRTNEVTINIGPPGVRLTLVAPIGANVRATIIDVDTSIATPIGTARITRDGTQTITFAAKPFLERFGTGRTTRFIVKSDPSRDVKLLAAESGE